jgi:hypothetical protein
MAPIAPATNTAMSIEDIRKPGLNKGAVMLDGPDSDFKGLMKRGNLRLQPLPAEFLPNGSR